MTAVDAVMSIFSRKRCELHSAKSGNEKSSHQKTESADFPERNSRGLGNHSPKTKKLELNSTNIELNSKKTSSGHAKMPDPSVSSGLKEKNLIMRVLLDSGSSVDLLFMKKGSSKSTSVVIWVVPQSWGTSSCTFVTDIVGDIEISFVEYSASKKVRLQPDIVEYSPGDQETMYDLIISKQTMHDLGLVLDFQERRIKIDEILLPMRNIANLQLNLELPGCSGKTPVWPKSKSVPAAPPSAWWKLWTLSMRKQIFQP